MAAHSGAHSVARSAVCWVASMEQCWAVRTAASKAATWVAQMDASMAAHSVAHLAARSVALTEMLWVGQKDEN